MNDEERLTLRGNLAAYEHLLGQLYVMMLEDREEPQAFLKVNALHILELLGKRENMTQIEKDAAYGSVRRVMETASFHFETVGHGPAIDLR